MPPTVLTFNPGVTDISVAVDVVGGAPWQAGEVFYVNLSSPADATILQGQGIGTIQQSTATPPGSRVASLANALATWQKPIAATGSVTQGPATDEAIRRLML